MPKKNKKLIKKTITKKLVIDKKNKAKPTLKLSKKTAKIKKNKKTSKKEIKKINKIKKINLIIFMR